jgi:hypothetical protein
LLGRGLPGAEYHVEATAEVLSQRK